VLSFHTPNIGTAPWLASNKKLSTWRPQRPNHGTETELLTATATTATPSTTLLPLASFHGATVPPFLRPTATDLRHGRCQNRVLTAGGHGRPIHPRLSMDAHGRRDPLAYCTPSSPEWPCACQSHRATTIIPTSVQALYSTKQCKGDGCLPQRAGVGRVNALVHDKSLS